ncbi:hypothetical protein IKG28_01505 [Candidatus Saccharibacteria bacterium]|nr:hypothetical protein [Candidatus Saccharibacteria bacterium]
MKKKIMAVVTAFMLMATTFLFAGTVRGVEPFYNITGLYLRSDEAEIGGKLYVDLHMLEKNGSTSIVGYFLNDNFSYVSLALKDINSNNPYFEIPSTMQAGTTYRMNILDVADSKGKITYTLNSDGDATYMNPLGKNVVHIKGQTAITGLELLGGKEIPYDGEIKLRLSTDRDVSLATVWIQNKDFPSIKALVSVNVNADSVIQLPLKGGQSLTPGEYQIKDVFLDPSDASKYVHYSLTPEDQTTKKLNYNIEFSIINSNNSSSGTSENSFTENILSKVSLSPETVGLNGKVNVELDTTKKISAATLIFNKGDESMTVNLKSLDSGTPYFIIPFTTAEGTYELDYAILKDVDGEKYQFRKGSDYYGIKHFDFDSTISVSNSISGGDLLTFDNNKITDEVINKIKELDDNIVIEIDANKNPIIRKETFDAIKGVNKTLVVTYADYEWTFNGLDVNDAKQIDVSAKIYNVNDADFAEGKLVNGLVLDFPENGELPGKCLIKIYNTKYIADILHRDNVNIYYYNEESGMFEPVEFDSAYNDKGFYEFYMAHNSNYVMTTERIDPKYVLNGEGDRIPMIIAISATVVLMVIMVATGIVIVKKKQNKNDITNITGQPQQPLGMV